MGESTDIVRPVTGTSVVLATQHRTERLRRLLDALASQEGDFEIVAVADGATPEVLALLRSRPEVRLVELERSRGVAAARNAGWRAATGDTIVFTDDDCVPTPGWLRELLAADGDVVQGRVEPDPSESGNAGPFSRTLRVDGAGPFFQTANIRYPRALLERLGGFDESFHASGEDADLGWRALEAGARIAYAPEALVHHAVHPHSALDAARHAWRWRTAVRNVSRHPRLREHLHHRVFWRPSHERVLAAAAAWRLGPLPGLAATAWWVAGHRGEHPSLASLGRSVPGHLLVDAAEVAAMARGSVSARTLLL